MQMFVVAIDRPVHALSSTAAVTCPFERCSTYKQIKEVLMDCTFPVWWSLASNRLRRLQVLQPKCLRTDSQRTVVRWLTTIL